MKPRKKRIIRSMTLDEISAVGTPAQAGALHAITKSQPDIREPITGPIVLTGEQRERANAWAAEYLKTLKKNHEEPNMTENVTKDYATLTKHYADKWDITPEAAGARLMRDRPDLVAESYNIEQAAYVQRQVDARNKVYGDGQ